MSIPEALTPWLLLGTAFVAFTTAVGLAVRYSTRKVRATLAWFRALGDAVQAELTPNDGESMKDHVAEIHARQIDGDAVFENHERRIKALEGGD